MSIDRKGVEEVEKFLFPLNLFSSSLVVFLIRRHSFMSIGWGEKNEKISFASELIYFERDPVCSSAFIIYACIFFVFFIFFLRSAPFSALVLRFRLGFGDLFYFSSLHSPCPHSCKLCGASSNSPSFPQIYFYIISKHSLHVIYFTSHVWLIRCRIWLEF